MVEQLVRRNRDAHEVLSKDFSRIWLCESKPFALERTMKMYAKVVKWYDDLVTKLADARKQAEAGKPIPTPAELGLVSVPAEVTSASTSH